MIRWLGPGCVNAGADKIYPGVEVPAGALSPERVEEFRLRGWLEVVEPEVVEPEVVEPEVVEPEVVEPEVVEPEVVEPEVIKKPKRKRRKRGKNG